MAMRDSKGKFIKRMKDALSNSAPATVTQQEFANFEEVTVDEVPSKTNSASSTQNRAPNMTATVTIIGNLTADPELRVTNNGKSVTNFSLAYTPRKPDGSDGNVSFYNVAAWDFLAENFAASFKKGDRLVVLGRLTQDKWEDKDSGKNMSRLVITADEIGGTCRFHTVEMTKINLQSGNGVSTPAEGEPEDIFA